MLVACLFWGGFLELHGASASVFALSLATSTGPSCLHGNPFLMSAYLHIRTAQREGEGAGERQIEQKEPERERERAEGELKQ